MRHLIIATALAVGLGFAPVALAATTHVANGTVKSVDMAGNTVTLKNGKVYKLPKGFKTAALKAGEHVKISYQINGRALDASKIALASNRPVKPERSAKTPMTSTSATVQ
ncbi:DUF1344 domain-containing protein [Aurantimonas sp. VKM B-3413]|uniref:DUF1344 domain-containing protein n=1 Tax=Aurantimonas sp. VKM B-3413 TaxID=2779401 RepID=UPI001E58966E|nr:DUF1344 domain-containing protein [Aurantimonas sp. VKM B-3413]MCB8840685.1 DUF1344 domain-containing protein [Aurantimonas sp. VKM B-3413]